ncbi:MAG: hypothetical protein ACHQ1G_11030, partial [Planctomycetota bacterium]
STPQYVRFETPEGAKLHVLRSLAADGENEGRVPGTWSVRPGAVYDCEILFDRAALKGLGFSHAEIDTLERQDRLTLRGGLVAFEEGDRGQTVLLGLDAEQVRAALADGDVAIAQGIDVKGEVRALLKVSLEGVPLDDPELACHGKPVKSGLVYLGNVCIAAGRTVLYVAYVGAQVLVH